MSYIQEDAILEYRSDTVETVRKLYNLEKPGRMKEAIDILEDWIKKQEHFVNKEFNRDYLERLIIRNKGLLERVKMKLDKMCTLKTLAPQFFGLYIFKEDFLEDIHVVTDAVLPKLTSDHNRIYITKNSGKEFSDTFIMNCARKTVVIWEYLLKHDYSSGLNVILDFVDTNILALTMKIDLSESRQIFDILMGGYGMRLTKIHILASSKVVEKLVFLIKQVLSKKIGDRIFIHYDMESLKNAVEVDLLPQEYGGKERTLRELHEKWLDVLSSKEHMDYLKVSHEMKTDETRRTVGKFNEHYLGTPGTFRSMVLD